MIVCLITTGQIPTPTWTKKSLPPYPYINHHYAEVAATTPPPSLARSPSTCQEPEGCWQGKDTCLTALPDKRSPWRGGKRSGCLRVESGCRRTLGGKGRHVSRTQKPSPKSHRARELSLLLDEETGPGNACELDCSLCACAFWINFFFALLRPWIPEASRESKTKPCYVGSRNVCCWHVTSGHLWTCRRRRAVLMDRKMRQAWEKKGQVDQIHPNGNPYPYSWAKEDWIKDFHQRQISAQAKVLKTEQQPRFEHPNANRS